MKAIRKDYFREIKTRKGQFISIFLIVLIGAAFFSGIRSGRSAMEYTANRYFIDNKFMDIHIVSNIGFEENDIKKIKSIDGISEAYPSFSMEALSSIDNESLVMKVLAYNKNVNKPIIKKGRLLKNNNECLIDEEYAISRGVGIGDSITLETDGDDKIKENLKHSTYEIAGIINMPQYLAISRGSATIGSGKIDNYIVINQDAFKSDIYSDVYIVFDDIDVNSIYDEKYKNYAKNITNKVRRLGIQQCEAKEKVLNELDPKTNIKPTWYVTNRDDNEGYHDYIEESRRVDSIGKVFPILFFVIAALITLTSMTRIVEDQRQQIGMLKAMGYTNRHMFLRYISFALFPTLTGSIIGVLFGEKFFPYIIMDVFYVLYTGNDKYYMPYNIKYALFAILACVISTLIATTIACKRTVDTNTCELMKTQAPIYKEKLWIENISLWKNLKYSVKSSVRNIFRYKKRLITTIIGIGGCMGLIVVACGLNDSIKVIPEQQFKEIINYDMSAILSDETSKAQEDELYYKIRNMNDISNAIKAFGANVELSNKKINIDANLIIPSSKKDFSSFITLRDRKTKLPYHVPKDGAIISEKAAKLLGVKKGDNITIKIDEHKKATVKIAYITETYFYHYIYISTEQYKKLYDKNIKYNQILAIYDHKHITNLDKFNEDLGEDLVKIKNVLGVSFMQDMVEETDNMVERLNAIVYILLISAAALTLVVIYNLNSINIRERHFELATLKTLGFYDNEVANYIYRENIILTGIGIVIGIFIGKYLHRYIIEGIEMNQVMFGVIIEDFSFFVSASATVVFTVIVNFLMKYKIKKIDLTSAIKYNI